MAARHVQSIVGFVSTRAPVASLSARIAARRVGSTATERAPRGDIQMQTTSAGLPVRDVAIVRELAAHVAELAALPVQQETIRLWEDHNGLRPQRPMAMIDELPWHEMNVDDELTVMSEDPFCRRLEEELRQTLYRWRHMRVDMVIEPYVDVYKVIRHSGYGVRISEDTIPVGDGNTIVSHRYEDQLATPEDIEKFRVPEISLDVGATAEVEAKAHECLDGILDVRMQGFNDPEFSFGLWDDIEQLHGTENILYDFIDRPEFLHAIAERFTEVRLAELDILEEKGLLGYGLDRIHCTGAQTPELPKPGFDPLKPRAIDNWISGRSQLFVSTSDATFAEFVVPYYSRYYARWGLGLFGCCDPLHDRVEYVRRMPNIRKISMSPWAKVQKGAEEIGRDYVFSRKPNPAMVAMDRWVPEIAVADFEETLAATRANGCPVEFTLKDISTCRYDPRRLWEWCAIADRMVRA